MDDDAWRERLNARVDELKSQNCPGALITIRLTRDEDDQLWRLADRLKVPKNALAKVAVQALLDTYQAPRRPGGI